jgi:phosphopantetheinyl transferase
MVQQSAARVTCCLWATAGEPEGGLPRGARRDAGRALALQLLVETGKGIWTIEDDPRGKPTVHGVPARHVSISHTGRILAAAASILGPVGIDIERHDARRDVDRLAKAAFGPDERRAVLTGGPSAFYRIWTIREALAKATGEGMAQVIDGVDRVPPAATDGSWIGAGNGWIVAHGVICDEVSLALAVHAPGADARAFADLAQSRII